MLHEQSDLSASAKARPQWSTQRRTSLLVISDVRIVRDGIAQALSVDPRLDLCGAVSPENAGRVAARLAPDVALIDMRAAGALDAARALRASIGSVQIVAVGVAESDAMLLDCAQAGISGFVAPEASTDALVAAIQNALRGELVCTPRIAGMLLNRVGMLASNPASNWETDQLTPREREIAVLIGEGLSNKQIACALGIQNATVKNHVHNVLGKMRLSRRSQVGARLHHPASGDDGGFPTAGTVSSSAASHALMATA